MAETEPKGKKSEPNSEESLEDMAGFDSSAPADESQMAKSFDFFSSKLKKSLIFY